jgi:phosphoribosylaminoimidazolecarboxamide formyltransferase / IMP cyclohydrolase
MTSETLPIRQALISVADKKNLLPFARFLSSRGIRIISTGGTSRTLQDNGVPVVAIEQITGFPEILGGRVKTLHPKIHGGILARRDDPEHLAEMKKQGIEPFDLVICNLYPFQQTVDQPGTRIEEAIEQIDIGGVTLIRAAAKNYLWCSPVTSPDDYGPLQREIEQLEGGLSMETRKRLAVEAFHHTAAYDQGISVYLSEQFEKKTGEVEFPESQAFQYRLKSGLRYGENPHQKAAFYEEQPISAVGLSRATVHQGKELSFNNLVDLDAALTMVRDFDEPAVAILKHNNPCGLATASTLKDAYRTALECDPLSAYGSVIGLNREVDPETARLIHETGFVEAVLAPEYAPGVLTLFSEKKNRRILELSRMMEEESYPRTVLKSIAGGMLIQENDLAGWEDYELQVVTSRKPTEEEEQALKFAFKAAKHVKSNSIVLVQGTATVGIGAGQMSRVDSCEIAIRKAGDRAKGAVLGSDAFFPFRDGLDLVAGAGVTAVIQPGGSKRDDEVIEAANEHDIAMIFTGRRHFRH